MIFILHYCLFGGALPAAVVFISIYLRTYTTASMSEIGTLLKLPAFVLFILKPLVCGLADRHQAHRNYLIGALACMSLGYGSLTVFAFLPQFLQEHGRIVWYVSALCVIVGSSGQGLVWSLGDALAINGAEMVGADWGHYRLWALVTWGLLGAVASQVNELAWLPRFVPGMFLLALLMGIDIVLFAVWPRKYFVMYGKLKPDESIGEKHQQVVASEEGAVVSKKSQVDKDTQTTLLKFIARRDKLMIGYVILLTILGFVSNAHLAYFYLHVQQVCQATGAASFATMSGALMMAHSVAEISVFLLMPRIKRALGPVGTITACACGYTLMQLYHGTIFAQYSPYYAIPMELLHGLAVAVMYTLVKDAGLDVVNRVDAHLPEMQQMGLVEARAEVTQLKACLRATMHGLMGGAYDGLGGGLGTLVGGIFLDYFSFATFWRLCAALDLLVALAYPLLVWRARARAQAAPKL